MEIKFIFIHTFHLKYNTRTIRTTEKFLPNENAKGKCTVSNAARFKAINHTGYVSPPTYRPIHARPTHATLSTQPDVNLTLKY